MVKAMSEKLKDFIGGNLKTILLIVCILGLVITSILIIIWLWPLLKVLIALLALGTVCGGCAMFKR